MLYKLKLCHYLSNLIQELDILILDVLTLYIHHRPIYLNCNLNDVLQTVSNFLKEHPTETVVMRISKVGNVSSQTFNNKLEKYVKECPGLFYKGYSYDPSLGSMRGKIRVLDNVAGDVIGLNYSFSDIQDNYNVSTDCGLY